MNAKGLVDGKSILVHVVPPDKKPLSQLMLTQVYLSKCRH